MNSPQLLCSWRGSISDCACLATWIQIQVPDWPEKDSYWGYSYLGRPRRAYMGLVKRREQAAFLVPTGVPTMKALFLCFLVACATQITNIAWAADSDLDPTFGVGGRVLFDQWRQSSPTHAIVQQSDGKLVLASSSYGDTNLLLIARMQSDGTLDPSFGDGGIVTGDREYETALDVIEQLDKKLVVGGFDWQTSVAMIWRFNSNGDLDTTFGTSGVVHVDIAGFDAARKILQQPDGKLIVAGVTSYPARLLLARFNADGVLDPTFGAAGTSTIDLAGENDWGAFATLVPQTDGRLVVTAHTPGQLVVLRITEDGVLDQSFGTSGFTTIAAAENHTEHTITAGGSAAIQDDGKIVVSAMAAHCDFNAWGDCISRRDGFIVRLEPSGSIDPTLGLGKIVVHNLGFFSIHVEVADTIVCSFSDTYTIGLMKFMSNGSLDTDFGNNGRTIADFGSDDQLPIYVPQSTIRQADGKHVVLAGYAISGTNIGWYAAIARFGTDSSGFAGLVGVSHGYATEGYPAVLEFGRTGGSSGAISVNFQTVDGTARAERDYVSQSGQITWSDGDSSLKYIEIATIDDDEVEGDTFETFTIQLSDPTNGALLTNSIGSIDIADDDQEAARPPPPPDDGGANNSGGGGGAMSLEPLILLGLLAFLWQFGSQIRRRRIRFHMRQAGVS